MEKNKYLLFFRFLASEVKPFAPEVEVKSAKRGRKRKQEISDQETELKAEIVEKKPASIKEISKNCI